MQSITLGLRWLVVTFCVLGLLPAHIAIAVEESPFPLTLAREKLADHSVSAVASRRDSHQLPGGLLSAGLNHS